MPAPGTTVRASWTPASARMTERSKSTPVGMNTARFNVAKAECSTTAAMPDDAVHLYSKAARTAILSRIMRPAGKFRLLWILRLEDLLEMSVKTVRKIRSIEGLRGVLALWVLFSHVLAAAGLGGAGWRGPFRVIESGTYAVEVFIIISGFVIFYLLDTAQESYGRFLWRRFLRLYPVYLLSLLISILLLPTTVQVFLNAPWPHFISANNVAIAESSINFLPQHLAAHLFMLQSLIPSSVLPFSNYAIVTPAWSLSLEWQFYVLAPILFAAFAAGPRTVILAIVIACSAHFLLAGDEGFLPRHLPMFALGITSYYLWRLPWRPSSPMLGPIVVALAYLLTHDPGIVIWSAVFMAAYEPGSFGLGVLRRTLEHPLSLALGRMSYSVYLMHEAVLTLLLLVFENANVRVIGHWPFFAVLLLSNVSGTLCVTWALYRYVEVPCIAFGKREARGRMAVPPVLKTEN